MLVKVPETEVWLVAAAPPVKPEPEGADQLYVVPAGTKVEGGASTGVTEKDPPLQIVAVWLGMSGFGLMVTVAVKLDPVHVPEVGVTVKRAV